MLRNRVASSPNPSDLVNPAGASRQPFLGEMTMSESEGFGAYTDYGKLRGAIVGIAEGLVLPPFNPTLHHYNDEVQAALKARGDQPLDIRTAMPERWEKTTEQLDSLAALYQENGIAVSAAALHYCGNPLPG